ncbi:Zinc finger, FYVE/PHD-type [Quillaja saponaria]|uniref:Zinc finger, FYVE/PHD-type n=1 Tax=Quillaja saponaria TaxID=32244 RepID=A0AAD7VK63_QUISA|nr:Zinc finger, FYVE/PHD-type [Quillaja saponaria]
MQDQPCDICGVVGYPEVIATCSKCSITREHAYCMWLVLMEIPEDWVCDSCLPNHDIVSPHSDGNKDSARHLNSGISDPVHEDSGHQFHKRKNSVSTGKVKFISTEEVIKLSSGAPKEESPSWSTFGSKSVRVNSKALMSQRTPVGPKTLNPTFPPVRVIANPSMFPSGHRKPSRSGAQVSPMVNQQAPRTLLKERKAHVAPVKECDSREQCLGSVRPTNKVENSKAIVREARDKASSLSTAFVPITSTEKMSLVAPRKEHKLERQQTTDALIPVKAVDAVIPVKEVEPLNIHIEKATIECTSISPARLCSPAVVPGGTVRAVAECNRFPVEKRELDALPKLELYLPSLLTTWKGGFKLIDTSGSSKFYDGFQAQPPCRVHRKAYELSCGMPPVLQVEPVHQFNIFENIFQKNGPDLQEIALYFFHSDGNMRSKQNYDKLFEFMSSQNLMLRGYIDGVELLVFTSKQLNVDSQDTFAVVRSKAEYFLWGVFRCVQNELAVVKLPEEPHFLASSLEHASSDDFTTLGKCEVTAMDVDMVGGKDVGRVDLVLKNTCRSLSIFPEEGVIPESSLQKLDETTSITEKDLDSCIKHLLLESREFAKEIRSEFALDLPFTRSFGNVTNGEDNMGGFCHVQNVQAVVKLPEEPHFLASSLEHASSDVYNSLGKCEVADMDVDMVGGKDVGRVDLVLKNASRSLSIFPEEGAILKRSSQKLDEKTSSIAEDLDTNVKHLLLESKEFKKKIKSNFAFDLL